MAQHGFTRPPSSTLALFYYCIGRVQPSSTPLFSRSFFVFLFFRRIIARDILDGRSRRRMPSLGYFFVAVTSWFNSNPFSSTRTFALSRLLRTSCNCLMSVAAAVADTNHG